MSFPLQCKCTESHLTFDSLIRSTVEEWKEFQLWMGCEICKHNYWMGWWKPEKIAVKTYFLQWKKKVTTKFLWRDELRKLGYRSLPSSALQEIRTDFQVILEVCLRELEYLYLLAFVWDFFNSIREFQRQEGN